jgi:hypothetical protein
MPKNQLRPVFAGFRQQSGGSFAFTMVPNQFLDEIVPYEKPCVVKVVGLILRRTLGWVDEKGQRRQQDQVSYSEFAREMNMSLQAVADGLKIALEKGYILRVKPGAMHGGTPEGAWYSLRWSTASESQSESRSKNQSDPALKSRDMINKAESKKTGTVEIKTSSIALKPNELQTHQVKRCPGKTEVLDAASPNPGKKYSAYIGNVITELGQQFGDDRHRLPNIKHALNLWDAEKINERDFVRLLYQARDITRTKTSVQTAISQTAPKFKSWLTLAVGAKEARAEPTAIHQPRNRMPYFFRVLEELVSKSGNTPQEPEDSRTRVDIINKTEQPDTVVKGESSLSRSDHFAASNKMVSHAMTEAITPQTLSTENPPTQDKAPPKPDQLLEQADMRRNWAEHWSLDAALVESCWDSLIANLDSPVLKGVAVKALGIEAELARPELRAALNLKNKDREDISTELDIILICRNAFEARHIARYLVDLHRAARQCWREEKINFHPVYF